MKIWALVWLLLEYPWNLTAQTRCKPGEIRLEGRTGQNPTAGRIQICDNDGQWREVCDRDWDENDAKVVCKQLGFSEKGAEYCGENCFGISSLNRRIFDFGCTGTEERLIDCSHDIMNGGCTSGEAGVACISETENTVNSCSATMIKSVATTETITSCLASMNTNPTDCSPTITETITSCSVTATSPTVTKGAVGSGQLINEDNTVSNCTALSGSLGALAGVMALGLLGILIGWVCSCCIRKRRENLIAKSTTNNERITSHSNEESAVKFDNPTYTSDVPSKQHKYSSYGPKNVPPVYDTYDVIENGHHAGDSSLQREVDAEEYEVPIQTRRSLN